MDTTNTIEQPSIDEARALLTKVREENEADLASARETLARLADDGTGSSGSMTDVVGTASHMVADAERILAEVTAAFARIDAGTYGQCTSCGKRIGEGRLRLRPYVRTCIDCAQ